MSNRVTIQKTTFIDHPSGETTYGFRIYDDYQQDYINTCDKEVLEFSVEQVLHFLLYGDTIWPEHTENILDWAKEHGAFVNDTWVDADELLEMMSKMEDDQEIQDAKDKKRCED